MRLVSLERRLRALKARRSGAVATYLAWGRTRAEAEDALRVARDASTVTPRDDAAVPDPGPAPDWRRVALGRKHEADLTDREVEILHDAYEAVARERAGLIAAGEDVSVLERHRPAHPRRAPAGR